MTLQERQQASDQLSAEEQPSLLEIDRHDLVNQLRGCLKQPEHSIPTDADIEAMREDRLVEKYFLSPLAWVP
ncbi:hypothetical protein [Trichothermofontia sp.]